MGRLGVHRTVSQVAHLAETESMILQVFQKGVVGGCDCKAVARFRDVLQPALGILLVAAV